MTPSPPPTQPHNYSAAAAAATEGGNGEGATKKKKKRKRKKRDAPVFPPNALYIGNLSWGVEDDAFAKLFADFDTTYAEVQRISNGRSRGYGVVCLTNAEDMDTVIAQWNGKAVDGWVLCGMLGPSWRGTGAARRLRKEGEMPRVASFALPSLSFSLSRSLSTPLTTHIPGASFLSRSGTEVRVVTRLLPPGRTSRSLLVPPRPSEEGLYSNILNIN